MSTRILIGAAVAAMLFGAYLADNLAAIYISIVGGAVVYLLHTIEFKINQLLDYHGITVMDRDVSRD
jgi:hypothetical protein